MTTRAICAHVSAAIAAAFLLAVAFHAHAQFIQPEAPSEFAETQLVRAENQIVVTANPLATDAALEALRQGGGAIDAAIVAQMVLNLVEPQSSGIGGGGLLLYFDRAAGEVTSYDGRETAPSAATPRLFLDENGDPLPKRIAMKSGISVGVPGLLAMLAEVHEAHGKLSWQELFQPAIESAKEGFEVSPRLRALLSERDAGFTQTARRYFLDPSGKPWPIGHVLKNPELAKTLETIAREGRGAFYNGAIAAEIAEAVQTDPRIPGTLTAADIAAYEAKARPPVCVNYRRRDICGMGPPSSGGFTVAQALKLAEPFDLGGIPLATEPVHLILEAEALAYSDRNRYLADPDYVPQPIDELLAEAYLEKRRALIDPERSHAPFAAGEPEGIDASRYGVDQTREGGGTTHISILDADGNAVALTSSVETAFGSGIMVHGFLLNNQLTDFSFVPEDEKGRPIANRPQGGKRPRSSMSPTIVRGSDGALAAVLGSPGGPAIILYVVKALVAHIDWNLNAEQAVALANFGSIGRIGLVESLPGTERLAAELKRLGHDIRSVPLTSGLGVVFVEPDGTLTAAADPRREGTAAGD